MHTKLTHFKILEYSFLSGIISSNVCVVLNRNFHSNVNVLGRVSILSVPDEGYSRNVSGVLNLISTFYHKHFLTSLYRSTLFDIFLNPDSKRKYLQVWRIYFRNLSVQRSCLQYTSQCLKKVNVKSTHISSPASLLGLIRESRSAWYQGRYGKCHVIIS